MTDIKQAIELLERMTAEPAPGVDARLDADELDAVLLAIKALKAPPIKPKRMTINKDTVVFEYIPRGKWVEPFERNGKTYHKCNHCHISSELILFDNFCPHCGALMTSEVTT